LRDGYAVRANDTADASSYAPVLLSQARMVQTGDRLPADTDAVIPPDGVVDVGGIAAVLSVAGGDGVLAAGGDARAGALLREAGRSLRQIDVAALQVLGMKSVKVRMPRVLVVGARASDAVLDSIVGFAERLVAANGGEVLPDAAGDFHAVLSRPDADLIVVAGGSGMGERDASITTLQGVGHLHFHGIGIAPGETAALGFVDTVPVLIVPGRADGAFAALVTVGDAIVAWLSGRAGDTANMTAVLSRKVVSTIGLVEVAPVALSDGHALPLASSHLPMQAMIRADGYVVVPADSEGFPAGSTVAVRMMP
jgi:molybdopterin biosynthesis enzyme